LYAYQDELLSAHDEDHFLFFFQWPALLSEFESMNKINLPLIWLILFTSGCIHDPVIQDSPLLTFEANVKAITLNNCARSGCHDGNEEDPTLITYNDVMSQVKPGDPKGSELYKVITKLSGEKAMPPDGPLSDQQIQTIYIWILQGAKEK
jgi:hypothetical protein